MPLPQTGSRSANGFSATASWADFPADFQFLNAIARSNEHVPRFREVRFVAERAVSRNNLGVIVGEPENFVGGDDHAIDIAARTGVDVGIHAVEKQVAHGNHPATSGDPAQTPALGRKEQRKAVP
jgi:hypothetical protein